MNELIKLFYLQFFLLWGTIGCSTATVRSNSSSPGILKDERVVLFQVKAENVKDFFNTEIVLVSKISGPSDKADEYLLDYPSINDGASPLYSHSAVLTVAKGVPYTLDQLVEESRFGIFRKADHSNGWCLVGVVKAMSTSEPFDWFSDKPFYLHQRSATRVSPFEEAFKVFMNYQRDILACKELKCFRAVTTRYSSKEVTETLLMMDDPMSLRMLEQEQESAASFREQGLYYEEIEADQNELSLILKHRRNKYLNERVMFRRESGNWKIAKRH